MLDDDGGSQSSAGQDCPAHKELSGGGTESKPICDDGKRAAFEEVTSDEQAAIKEFLKQPGAARPRDGRSVSVVRAALKFAGVVLLAAGVVGGYADGDELDDVGCTVAAQSSGGVHDEMTGQPGERPDEKTPPPESGGAGAAGGGGGPGVPECVARAGRCVYRLQGGMCQISEQRCRLMPVRSEECRVQSEQQTTGGANYKKRSSQGGAAVAEKGRYVLRRGLGGWWLVFGGQASVLWDDKAVSCVAVLLLDPPVEPIHGTELAHLAFGDAVVEDQRNLGLDDADTAREMAASRAECQGVIEDEGASEVEREEARAELERIEEWARKHLRGTESNEQRQVRALRQNIRRLLEKLRAARERDGRPNEVLRAFGEHLERYLWEPSGRAGYCRNSRLRAGLAGRFTYEPPEGVRWSG
jgi:hypothetical protein